MPVRRRAAGRARTDLPPLKIVRKILLLQLAFYVSGTALILFTTLVYGTPFSLDLIFSWDAVRGDTTVGWMLSLVWMLNSLPCVLYLLVLVSRSKLIPDFALTLHFLHLIATCLYSRSIPANWLWWGLQCASAALMTFGGVWACQWRELRPISFGGIGGATSQQKSDIQPPAKETGIKRALGFFSRGHRGRGSPPAGVRDRGGEYEMLAMNGPGLPEDAV